MRVDKPGIYSSEEIPMHEYVADPCPEPALSKGIIKAIIARSPAHAWCKHPRLGNQGSYSHRADIGSSCHSMLLGGAEIHYLESVHSKTGEVVSDFKTKAAREERDEAMARGEIPMLEHERGKLEAMADVARDVLDQFGHGETEQTLIWQEDGVWCKSRPDWVSADGLLVIDYKTATNADPIKWVRTSMMPGGYDIQGALVMRGLDKILGEDERRRFVCLVQEIDPPYACSLVGVSPELRSFANDFKITPAIGVWRECLANGKFPGYPNTSEDIKWVDVPTYERFEYEERNGL